MKTDAEIKVLRHLADELDLMSESKDLDVATAAVEIRPLIENRLLTARRAAAAAAESKPSRSLPRAA